ncbi:MAG: hypothetical protein KGL25_09440 [Gammaproteobacteria bacterium]|nr:hypothetical protein [Gammaproteobacteria bacterium]
MQVDAGPGAASQGSDLEDLLGNRKQCIVIGRRIEVRTKVDRAQESIDVMEAGQVRVARRRRAIARIGAASRSGSP